ncbi:MAG: penicillin-binding protein 1C [Myxococcota bacterium]
MGRRNLIIGALLAATIAVVSGLLAAWWLPLPARLSTPGASVVRYRDGTIAHVFLSPDERWRLDIPAEEIDPDYITALIAAEDARFWWHPGVDPLAIARAATQNLLAGRVVSGGSTLTMQLARMLEPRPRTPGSKMIEALRAFQMELRLSKSEILSAYLRFVPYGGNLEGVSAASLAYFGHPADALSATEIATLLAVPQRPADRAPSPKNAAALKTARDRVALRLLESDALPRGGRAVEAIAEMVTDAPVPVRRAPLPREAPHAAFWLRGAPGQIVDTRLDPGVQAAAERSLAEARRLAERMQVYNASIVVIERESADVVAMVGGFDFWDEAHGGQIPSFAVARSPGSALKPLLYAASVDAGQVLPEQLVEDLPTRYGAYAPQNYDGRYDGVVTLEDALSRSLNVPFINLLADFGVERFLGTLRAVGAKSLRPQPGFYGLSLIAGGIELTPLELAGAYRALGAEGRYRAPRLIDEPGGSGALPVFSSGASWLTRRTLSRRDRPDFPVRASVSATPRSVWWKTGTSFGNRDAWAIGGGQRYIVAVWLGNLDNRPSPWLVGASAAGPILFDLLEALGDDRGTPSPAPSDLSPIEVCALSGHLPGPHCVQRATVMAPSRRIPPERCPFHRRIEVDEETGLQVTPSCRAGRPIRSETVVIWPTSVRRWLQDRRLLVGAAPPMTPGCGTMGAAGPTIRSPAAGEVTLLIPGLPPEDQEVAFEADIVGSQGELSWFVNGRLVGVASAEARVWWTPREGDHEVVVTDANGRSDRILLQVRAVTGETARRR